MLSASECGNGIDFNGNPIQSLSCDCDWSSQPVNPPTGNVDPNNPPTEGANCLLDISLPQSNILP